MLTSFDQVREWIKDNGFKRWVLYKDYSKTEKIIDSAAFPVSDQADKIAMTEKYLRWSGGNAYAAGGASGSASDLNVVAEIRLSDAQPQGTSGIGNNYPSIGELTETITKQVRAEMAAEDFKRREKELAEREKDFNEKQNGVIGALVGVFAPYLPVLNQVSQMRKVAGIPGAQPLDTEEPVVAQPIVAARQEAEDPGENQEPTVYDNFTDEEGQEIFELMARFKKIEPENYLPMLRKMVQMAESGNSMYNMAKNVLLG